MDQLIIFGAKYLIFLIILGTAYTWWRVDKKNRTQFLAAIIAAGILAGLLAKGLSHLYYHPRPFVTEHIKPLVSHGADNGFPSEHSILAGTLATVIYFYRKKFGAIAAIAAVIVGASRVLAHVHAPIDIVAGLLAGFVAGYIGQWLARRYLAAK